MPLLDDIRITSICKFPYRLTILPNIYHDLSMIIILTS
nr:MAG TPA: hypothetical protein [Bacteriophage sp.]